MYYDLCLISLYVVVFNILCTYTYYYYDYIFFIMQSLNFVVGKKTKQKHVLQPNSISD